MRKVFCFAVLWAGMSMAAGAAAFEGTIDYEIHNAKDRVIPMHYEVKEPRYRMSMEMDQGKSVVIIYDTPKNAMYMLVPDRKMAMKHPMPHASAPAKNGAPAKKFTYTKTSRTETIAGYECTVYTYQNEDSNGEICSAKGMGTFHFAGSNPSEAQSSPNPWVQEAQKEGLFPLRVLVNEHKDGKIVTIVATHIEKKSLPGSEFDLPSDYKVLDSSTFAPGSAAGAPSPGQPGSPEFTKKMMSASPEERQKMIEDMKKQYGQGSSQQ